MLAQLPVVSVPLLGMVALIAIVLLNALAQVVAIWSAIKASKQETMPRASLEKELARLEAKIDGVHQERREVSNQIFRKIDEMQAGLTRAFEDFSRGMGRLEGKQDLAESIHAALSTIARKD